jgi:PIN domain nuclease of toxin-antitoxin system
LTRLLLDTNALLWWAADDPRLGNAARGLIRDAELVRISLVSLWEVAIKVSTGKLRADIRALLAGAEGAGVVLLTVTPDHCIRSAGLPVHHRDPFDRMLVAQAIEDGLTLVTSDRHLAVYGVRIVDCG